MAHRFSSYTNHFHVLAAGFTWATLAVFTQLLHDAAVPLFDQVFWRMGFVVIGAFVFSRIMKQRVTLNLGEMKYIFINAPIWLLVFTTLTLAIYFGIPIAKAIAIVYSFPLTVVPLSYLILGDVPSRKNLSAVGLTLVSLAVLFQVWEYRNWSDIQAGDLMALVNSVLAGAVIVWGTKLRRETTLPIMTSLFYTFLLALPLFIVGVVIANMAGNDLYQLHLSTGHGIAWLWLVGIAVLSTLVPVSLLYIGSKHLKPTVTSILLVTEPVWAYVFGLILFGQQLDVWSIIGSIGILLSVLLV